MNITCALCEHPVARTVTVEVQDGEIPTYGRYIEVSVCDRHRRLLPDLCGLAGVLDWHVELVGDDAALGVTPT